MPFAGDIRGTCANSHRLSDAFILAHREHFGVAIGGRIGRIYAQKSDSSAALRSEQTGYCPSAPLGDIDRHIGAESVDRREYGNDSNDTDVGDRELVPACGVLGFGEKLIAHSPLVKGADLAA